MLPTAVLDRPLVDVQPVRPAADPREARAVPSLPAFALIVLQLAALTAVFQVFNVEERSFHHLAAICFGGFAVHYWLPFRYKEWFWIGLSLAGAFVLMDPLSASVLITLALAIYGIATAALPFRARVGLLIGLGAVLAYGRATLGFGMPNHFWQVLGAIFMFRLAVYLYDIRHTKTRPTLREYLSYFLILPNFYFLLFPVIDYQTARKTYYQRDIHLIVQQGIGWILRGTVQLLLYRAIVYLKPTASPEDVTTAGTLVAVMLMTYLLYLRVSGHFHIIIGLLHLFGYDLPETHRRYLLARTLTDFWRRINIYWKDFMVKLVYFPAYFRLRKSGERRAQIVATSLVFVVTWLLHSYQWFWLRGEWLFTWTDTLFWAILGGLVVVNVLMERRRKVVAVSGWRGQTVAALQTAATFCFIVVLWSFWHAPTVGEWVDLVTWWRIG
jgi:D-alanyl-lipoteichoic acid acyltransferase DltB (MBOAT superfamily)